MIHHAKRNDVEVADMLIQGEQEGVFTKHFIERLCQGLWRLDKEGDDMFLIGEDSRVHARNIFNRLMQKRPIPLKKLRAVCKN